MSKIQVLSDLHNEVYRSMSIPDLKPTNADVVVLAGDIDNGIKGVSWAIKQSELLGKPIIYVPGNHEYYHCDLDKTLKLMRMLTSGTSVHVLDNDALYIAGARFLGSTFWTDYKAYPGVSQDIAMRVVSTTLNDHVLIRVDDVGFTPMHALVRHEMSKLWLETELAKDVDVPTVVVTHHGPSTKCQHADFELSAVSTGFYSNLDDLVGEADLWIYGHTHSNLDTEIKGTRLVSNQFGYAYRYKSPAFNPKLIVEV